MSLDLFGHLRHGGLIKGAARRQLDLWLPRHLEEIVERDELGLLEEAGVLAALEGGELPPILSFSAPRNDFDRWPEEQIPACVMVATGTASAPAKYEGGYYRAAYRLGIGVLVSAATPDATDVLADVYAAAVRGAILQRRSLGTNFMAAYWTADDSTPVPNEDRRSLAVGMNEFSVQIDELVSTELGPAEAEPPIDESAPYTATSVTPTVEPLEPEEP